jgi:hypothetical protein
VPAHISGPAEKLAGQPCHPAKGCERATLNFAPTVSTNSSPSAQIRALDRPSRARATSALRRSGRLRATCPRALLALVTMAAVCLLTLLPMHTTSAQTPPTLAGRWSASALRTSWNIGDWGPACGPQPSGGGAAGGMVNISEQGRELTISGAGRTYSTAQCWEQFPGLRLTSHSASARGWRNVCKTSLGDSRQATVITTITATDDSIVLEETGQYQFVIQDQNCTASVRRSRSYRLVQRLGASEPARAAPTSKSKSEPALRSAKSAPAPSAARGATLGACSPPGPPSRLEVRPSRKLMRPGEEFSFRARVLDQRGCPLQAQVAWRVLDESTAVELIAPGQIRIAERAPEGEVRLSATVAKRSVTVRIEIASHERYEALLRQRGFNEKGESEEAAITLIASGSIGAGSAVTQSRARDSRLWFAMIVGAAAMLVGVAGLVLRQRSRRRRVSAVAGRDMEAESPAAERGMRSSAMLCPTCGEEYPEQAQFCAKDGNRLITAAPEIPHGPPGGVCPVCGLGYDPGVSACPTHNEELVPAPVHWSAQEQPSAGRKICPICGTQYPGDGRFCGADGAALVPVN